MPPGRDSPRSTCGRPANDRRRSILRKYTPIAAIVAVLALGLAQPSIALPGLAKNTAAKAGKVHCKHVTAEAFREFSERTWRLPAWERSRPPERVIRAQRGKLKCAAGPGHRKAMRKRWAKDHRAFARHRGVKLEERRRVEALRATLEAIAACESGGDPTAVSANGSYRGKYQFDYSTWASVGGSGDPAAAPESEQDYRAALLYESRGAQPWPVCGA